MKIGEERDSGREKDKEERGAKKVKKGVEFAYGTGAFAICI